MRQIALALGLAVLGSAAAQRPALGQPRPHPPSAGPRPLLFGFAVDCTRCRMTPGEVDPTPVWHYAELPRVAAVRPGGAAARAGIQEGDTIVLVDGLSILSAEGARRFSAVRPGDRVRLTLHRNGVPVDAVIALDRPSPPSRVPPPNVEGQQRRYSGEVGGTAVDVWSASPVTVSVDSTGALLVRTGTATVRVAPGPEPSVPAVPRSAPLAPGVPTPASSPRRP